MGMRLEYRRKTGTAFEVVRDLVSGGFVKRTVDMDAPTTDLVINNRSGIWSHKFKRNDFVRLYDNEELVFDGKVFETKKSERTQQLTVTAWKKEYLDLFDTFCMEADLQNGFSAWNWGGEEVLDAGEPTLQTEGLRPDEIFLAGLGLRTEIQHFFSETDAILDTATRSSLQTSGTGGRENQRMLEIARLDEFLYRDDAIVVTKTLTNGLVGFNESPDVSTVRVRMSGYEPLDTHVEVRVSIDDGATWSTAQTPVYDASTGMWSDMTFASIPNDGTENLVRIEFKLFSNGPTNDETPKVRYFRATFTHPVSDTGITMGTIDQYVDPDTTNDTAGGDYNKRNRLEVVQGAVRATVAPAGEQYTHWIAYIDDEGAAHFRNPATFHPDESGVIFSKERDTCEDIEVTTVGQIINNLVYVGTGVGGGTMVITEENSFAAGILRNAASIAQFGEIQGMVTEKNVFSIAHGDKRARSIARLLSQEQKAVQVTLDPNDDLEVEVGMKARVESIKLDTELVARILRESFSFESNGLRKRELVLGNNIPSVNTVLSSLRRGIEAQNLTQQVAAPSPSVSFHDNVDKDHPCELAFYIPEDARIRRIGLHMKTAPFRTFSRVTKAGSAHVHALEGIAGAAGGVSVMRRTQAISRLGATSTSTNYGGQGVDAVGITGLVGGINLPSASSYISMSAVSRSVGAGSISSYTANQQAGSAIDLNDIEGVYVSKCAMFAEDPLFITGYMALMVSETAGGSITYVDFAGGTTAFGEAGTFQGVAFAASQFIPSSALIALGKNYLRGVTWEVRNMSASVTNHYHVSGTIYTVAKHNHGGASLNPNGTTDSKTGISSQTTLTAANIEALLGEMRIGYSELSGGVGPIAYTNIEPGGASVDFHEQHEHPVTGAATEEESEHTHESDHGIFEFDEDGAGKIWPRGIQVFIKNYPDPGDNPNPEGLNAPFEPFGSRGRADQSIEVQNMDLSIAFRDPVSGIFKTGFQQVWITTEQDLPDNPKGLGRMDAFLFIEQLQNVEK